jgi:hypothetical protein
MLFVLCMFDEIFVSFLSMGGEWLNKQQNTSYNAYFI